MIYLLYGQPGSGKTVLGWLLAEELRTPFVIDGDEFREMFSNKNYGKKGREENIRNANAVATYLNKKGKEGKWKAVYINDKENSWKSHPINKETDVVMSLVNPYKQLRKELKENNTIYYEDIWYKNEVVEILLESDRDLRKNYHVNDFEDGNPDYVLNTDADVEKTWEELKILLDIN
jgi:cytidylate kinase